MDEKEIHNNFHISIVKSQLLTDVNLSRNRRFTFFAYNDFLVNGLWKMTVDVPG